MNYKSFYKTIREKLLNRDIGIDGTNFEFTEREEAIIDIVFDYNEDVIDELKKQILELEKEVYSLEEKCDSLQSIIDDCDCCD